ncbi:hypothetical protein CR513_07900, partial [Mucuna pruriens]
MENQDRTLKERATPDVVYQPWCIEYPQLEPAQSYELKSGEDPHKHLKEFHMVCSTMRPQGIPEDYIKMKAFHSPWTERPRIGYIYCLYETHILGKYLHDLPNGHYPKRNMWNSVAYRRNTRILRMVQSLVCNLSTSSY